LTLKWRRVGSNARIKSLPTSAISHCKNRENDERLLETVQKFSFAGYVYRYKEVKTRFAQTNVKLTLKKLKFSK